MKLFLATALVAIAAVSPVYAKGNDQALPPPGAAGNGGKLVTACSACHGGDGVGVNPTYPSLAGQGYGYLLGQLEDFKDGKRTSSIMSGMARTIPSSHDHVNLKDVAAYFSQMKPMWDYAAKQSKATNAQIGIGKSIYEHGKSGDDIPACAACHGLGGEGNGPMAIPSLAGQHAAYIVSQLQRFASGKRHNSAGHVMHTISRKMTSKQRSAVAAYLQGLNPGNTLGIGPKDFKEYVQSLHANTSAHSAAGKKSPPATAATTK